MTQPAYIYARFSSIEQAKGHSLERQLTGARSLIERNGWLYSPEREMVDEGRSAFHGTNRAEGSALFDFEQKVREGHFANGAVLVVESLDRLTRQGHEETYDLLRLFTRNGVTVATFQDGQIYQTGQRLDLASIITVIVKGELSREEIEKRQQRILAVWDKKIQTIQDGDRKAVTSMVPAWLAVDPDTKLMSIDPYRGALLNQIYDWYIEGRGMVWIVKELNRRDEPTWSMKNNRVSKGWNSSSLHKMLTFRAVLGEYEPKARLRGQQVGESKGFVIPDYYPQAISTHKFNQAQAVRAGRQRTGGKSTNTQNNLFVGMMRCGHCDGPAYHQINTWIGQRKKNKKRNGEPVIYDSHTNLSYIRCNNWRRSHQCKNNVSIRYETLERAVLDYFFSDAIETIIKPDAREALMKEEIADVQRQIALKQSKLENAVEALTETPLKALAQKAADLEVEIEKMLDDVGQRTNELEVLIGQGLPADNLHIIRSIQEDLNSEDSEAQYIARVKTHTAFKNLIEKITIWHDGNTALWFKNGDVLEFDKAGYRSGGTDSYYAD